MKLHEYQAKELFAKEGVEVPPGHAALVQPRPLLKPMSLAETSGLLRLKSTQVVEGKAGSRTVRRPQILHLLWQVKRLPEA